MSGGAPRNLARFLEWDTEFFGVRIAALETERISDAAWREQLAWCRAERIECLYLLSEQDAREVHTRAEAAGALRVDERTTIAVEIGTARSSAPDPAVRLATEDDLPLLRAIAAGAHTNSRFWSDPHFARDRCAELYSIWIERDVRGRSTVFVVGPPGAPLGYVTLSLSPSEATLGLLAVAREARGQGLGRRLALRALEYARAAGRTSVGLVTQGPDNSALKLYESLGFRAERIEIWHHLWFPTQA